MNLNKYTFCCTWYNDNGYDKYIKKTTPPGSQMSAQGHPWNISCRSRGIITCKEAFVYSRQMVLYFGKFTPFPILIRTKFCIPAETVIISVTIPQFFFNLP